MSRAGPRRGGARPLRVLVLVLLGAAPLLAGAVHEPVFVPLLAGCAGGRPRRAPGARAAPRARAARSRRSPAAASCWPSTRSSSCSSSRCRPPS